MKSIENWTLMFVSKEWCSLLCLLFFTVCRFVITGGDPYYAHVYLLKLWVRSTPDSILAGNSNGLQVASRNLEPLKFLGQHTPRSHQLPLCFTQKLSETQCACPYRASATWLHHHYQLSVLNHIFFHFCFQIILWMQKVSFLCNTLSSAWYQVPMV